MNFIERDIYISTARNGEKFVYRCVKAGPDKWEFVDLMSWRHVTFTDDSNFFFVWEHSGFQHVIDTDDRDCVCVGDVDVESYGDLDEPKRQYDLETKRQLEEDIG